MNIMIILNLLLSLYLLFKEKVFLIIVKYDNVYNKYMNRSHVPFSNSIKIFHLRVTKKKQIYKIIFVLIVSFYKKYICCNNAE